MKQNLEILWKVPLPKLLAIALFFVGIVPSGKAANLEYIEDNTGYYTKYANGGDIFDEGARLGMWANQGSKEIVAWRTLKTAGDNTGSDRQLQVGDVFSITLNATSAFGGMGFSLNDNGTSGSSYANRTSGSRLFVQEVGTTASWEVNSASGSGGYTSLDYNVSTTRRDYVFKVYITSESTANVLLTADGTDKRAYNLTLNGTAGANIDSFSVWLKDDWNGSSGANLHVANISVEDLGFVEVGHWLTSGTTDPGKITDGLVSTSTSTTRANEVRVGGGSGTAVLLNQENTYTGLTTINADATARASHVNAFGTTAGGVSVTSGGAVELSGGISVGAEALTLNGTGISSGGALKNTSGNNTWGGAVTLNSNARINSDLNTLTLDGAIGVSTYSLYIGGAGNTTINGAITGSKTTGDGALFKDGTGSLTLSGNNATTLTGNLVLRSGTVSVANANSLGSGGSIIIGTSASATSTILNVSETTTRTGSLTVENTSTGGVVEVASTKTFTISGVLDQNGGTSVDTRFEKRGAGTLKLSGGTAGTYNGQIRISDGTLVAGSSGSLGDNTSTATRALDLGINLSAQASANNVRLDLANGVNLNQSMYVGANQGGATRTLGVEGGTGSATFQNEIYMDGNLTLDPGASGTLTVSGKITQHQTTGTQSIIKSSAGTVVLSGANDYKGTTTVNAGTLKLERLSGGVGAASITGSTIAVNNGGTLLLGAANQIASTTPITLNGGTLDTGGLADVVGKLKVTAASTILGMDKVAAGSDDFLFSEIDLADYGTSGSQLTFRPTSSTTYQIGDVIRLSTSNYTGWSGYSTTSFNDFQNKVKFGDANLTGSISFGGGYTTLTVAAIPEPKVYVAAGALALLIGFAEVRRRRKSVSSKA